MKTQKIGFIGLGTMGLRMARQLIYCSYPLMVYNRTIKKTDALVNEGARRATTLKQLARNSDVIITMVSDDDAICAVTEGKSGAFTGARPGTDFIDCSTISVKTTRYLSGLAEERGFNWLDAPVLGGPVAAEKGELPFVVGGPQNVLRRNMEIFNALGNKVVWMGESGMGQAAKIVHNMVCGIMLTAFSESLLLGEKFGLSRNQILELLSSGAVGCPLLNAKSLKFEQDNYSPSFSLALMDKDLTLAENAAREFGLTLLALITTKAQYDIAKIWGFGKEDSSAIFKALSSMGAGICPTHR